MPHSLRCARRWAILAFLLWAWVPPAWAADEAGLQPGDRIYQVNGQDFSGELELLRKLRAAKGPLRLRVERNGQLNTVEAPPGTHLVKRAV